MLSDLGSVPSDEILTLMQMHREDPRRDKIDQTVGVYRNDLGQTPVMQAVKAVEYKIWQDQTSKSYTGLLGDPEFLEVMQALVLGPEAPPCTAAAVPGGSGACRQAFELIRQATPGACVYVSDPTWANHTTMLTHTGLARETYRFRDPATGGLNFDGMMQDLGTARAGDVVLLHGCCHNPTGISLTRTQWRALADRMAKNGLVGMIDLAYLGFGDGLEEDAWGTRHLAETLDECLIAVSCSKNFGLYRERAGALLVTARNPALLAHTREVLAYLNRQAYSFPPDHGARIVTSILKDPALREVWTQELHGIRNSIAALRLQLCNAFAEKTGTRRFDYIREHKGMFSCLGATPEQVRTLRAKHGIYMVTDSRLNFASLSQQNVERIVDAVTDVGI